LWKYYYSGSETGGLWQVERLLKPTKPHSSSPWSSGWKKLSRMQIFHHHNKEETVMVPHLKNGGIQYHKSWETDFNGFWKIYVTTKADL
jgi:hypothetical protein